MTISYNAFAVQADYIAARLNLLLELEGPGITPYADNEGYITIGVGINLSILANRNLILALFGVLSGDPRRAALDSYLTTKHVGLDEPPRLLRRHFVESHAAKAADSC
jgi:hypothetical protein